LPYYELDPDCKFLHQPFRDVVPGLHGLCRSDRIIGNYNSYFLGRIPLEPYVESIKRWSGTEDRGATIIIAEDAEYTGTTAYFFVKYFRDYSRSFEVDPEGPEKLERLLTEVTKLGELITFREACELEPVEEPFFVEDGFAWHRTYADVWANTPESQAWDPILAELRREYKEKCQPILESDPRHRELVEKFWFHLTNSANSDGRWPPPPAVTCPFNRQWVLDEIEATRQALEECKRAVEGIELPEEEGPPERAEWEYGYPYTEKDTSDLSRLNYYELSHHLYAAYRMYDNGEGEVEERGRRLINAIYDEFERRGVKPLVDRRIGK
ncbi:MAG: hypothetical protein PVJ27_07955, partial [Candidatus Brocadiaceae bacterium]